MTDPINKIFADMTESEQHRLAQSVAQGVTVGVGTSPEFAAEPNPKLIENRIQALGELIAAEIIEQGNELDCLGDAETVVFMNKCPFINITQLAEKIEAFYKPSVEKLEAEIEQLTNDIAFEYGHGHL